MLPVLKISAQKRVELNSKLKELYEDIKSRFKAFGKFQNVLTQMDGYSSKDLKDEQEPEEFAKQFLIKPLIEFLGYETIAETAMPSPFGMKKTDYKIRPKNQDAPLFYVEAEPFNMNLNSVGHGISQVNDWLLSRASKTPYGIATDGFRWIILKFEEASSRARPFFTVDLKPVFVKFLNAYTFSRADEADRIEESFLYLHAENASVFLESFLEYAEEEREAISKKFYNDYVRYVFGFDEKGQRVQGTYLLKEIIPPSNVAGNEANLFAVIFMNRVLFIKFLEEIGIVSKNLLKSLLDKYKASGSASTFYEAYLKALFYEVFNKSKESRRTVVTANPLYREIPYLNGGLFRQVIHQESNYGVSNEGIELIIDTFLKEYKFGSKEQIAKENINPDVLGYIFEKTINYISGQGTNQQKAQGAYYTPDDVVGFIIDETLTPVIFGKMLEGLRSAGWRDIDLKDFDSIETLLNSNNRPKSRIAVRKMVEALDTIRVLDPACGSGHFLTAMLARILRVKESLMRSVDEEVDRYHLKREIISKNIYGVDIDANGVEIARLRLWLSLIEEVEDPSHIETLPNIDFNIVAGNSLIGWLHETLDTHPLIDLLEDSLVKTTLESIATTHSKDVTEVRKLLGNRKINDTIEAYERLIRLYSLESGELAVKIREAIENIRTRLYEVFNSSYVTFIHEKSNLCKMSQGEFAELSENLENRMPFHWKVDFGKVFENGGFDVVVGNPPYIENGNYNEFELNAIKCTKVVNNDGKTQDTREPLLYASSDCGNTHAYFIERAITLMNEDGKFGFIVPVSLVSTERMNSIRQFVHSTSSAVKYYSFDDRPAKIFSGIEHCRSTIIIVGKGRGVQRVTTSKYHKWYTKDRAKFLKNLKTTYWTIENRSAIVPKIGTNIEREIIEKLKQISKGKTLKDDLKNDGTDVWYYNAPQYWIHAHMGQYVPKIEYFDKYKKSGKEIIPQGHGKTQISSHYKELTVDSKDQYIVNGLLNSSLFYWWFVVWSDGRDLLTQHITSFPIDLSSFPKTLREQMEIRVTELMKSYEDNSNIKMNVRSDGKYCIRIKEIIPKKSKTIIDQIDDLFAEYYTFTEKEKEFVKTFDVKFRMED
jgi:type I restriction-modification system DNA methylase subunit